MGETMSLLNWKIMSGCILPQNLRKYKLEFDKKILYDRVVQWLRHYIRYGKLSVKTPQGTLLRLINLFMKLSFTFKFKYQLNNSY